ncbi:class I SAM-dependent methyltransferase [Pseudanabaena sp. Chao 1811]|uniref:class I SAM-dependent methyltransferase n=1 Tax=Pseudanabaena sp. Chao 1811 TaxID=2963092 RepID=UPI0022F3D707|nr:class I SAM-dependent methyltransferase [Pseudanabaena sp. Chao 1811]
MTNLNNTEESFRNKWSNNPDTAFLETLRENSDIFNWILTRNGFKNKQSLQNFLSAKKKILDAGCGNGRVTALLRKYSDPIVTKIVGFDIVSSEIAKENLSGSENIFFYKKDLLEDLSDLGQFDFIYCQEVLHHTNNPKQSFLNLVDLLENEGEIAIYVYKQKAPVREFVDDFIREKIAGLPYEEAMKISEQITMFGRALAEQNKLIKVPTVEILGIEGGEYDIQRLIYHFFMKCFWNAEMSMRDNIVINYDWYHPQNCTRHTVEEIRGWFENANLYVTHEYVDFYGITMRGSKK